MSSPTASAEVIPTVERLRQVPRDAAALRRLPTLDEVPLPSATPRRGEVVVYSGVSFGAARKGYTRTAAPSRSTASSHPSVVAPQAAPIEGMQFFTDHNNPGQIFARVMIMEPGSNTPREALITPILGVAKQDQQNLDADYALNDLVERANVEVTRFFQGFGPIDSEFKLREFRKFTEKQESLNFLFSNLSNRNKNKSFDLFSAYFAPGGAMGGVGVFLNSWL
jgi:hypothetical protein